jgi:hypothetical protein
MSLNCMLCFFTKLRGMSCIRNAKKYAKFVQLLLGEFAMDLQTIQNYILGPTLLVKC